MAAQLRMAMDVAPQEHKLGQRLLEDILEARGEPIGGSGLHGGWGG
jgi:hypothetical protein